jgi:threonyl-tRNA synthetase
MMKIPYLLVVGEQEQTNWSVNVRSYKTKEQEEMEADVFVEQIVKEYKERSL